MKTTLTKIAVLYLILGGAIQTNCMDTSPRFISNKELVQKLLLEKVMGEDVVEKDKSGYDFELDEALLPILKLAIEAEDVFLKCSVFNIFESFLKGIKSQEFHESLNKKQLIELAYILDKYCFNEEIFNAVCYTIAKIHGYEENDAEKYNCHKALDEKLRFYNNNIDRIKLTSFIPFS